MNFTITTKTTKKNLALVNVDQRCPVPKCEATITDRVPHLVRNSTVGNMLIEPCTSVEDKNSTEAIRMWGLFFSSLPRSLGSTCVNNSYNWAAHTVGREAGHREVFQQIRSQIYLASKQCRDAEPVAFHLELLGDGCQGNNQHRNGAFTQGRIENDSLKAER